MAKPTDDQIRERAQRIWEEHHRPDGRDEEFWLQAERELSEGGMDEPTPQVLPG
jgi:hypothetical protein